MGQPRFTFGPWGDNSRPWGIADNEEGNSEDGQGFHARKKGVQLFYTLTGIIRRSVLDEDINDSFVFW